MSSFSLSCTALVGTNKAGTLKCDADGYYKVVLGALDVTNAGGAFYPEASARALFKESSSLMRRIASGNLRGEYGHPRKEPGMSMDDFVFRVKDIYEPNVCMHIRKVTVDYSSFRTLDGRPMIAIIGEIRPSGPRGPALKEQLENKHEDVCFSIRSLTNDQWSGGRLNKHFKMIVTWDYVNEPGLEAAHKWNSPSLESHADVLEEVAIVPAHLLAMRDRMKSSGVSMESTDGVSMESLIEAVTETTPAPAGPKWASW